MIDEKSFSKKMRIKIITYNIDGLPEKLDLNDLPWLFKPLVWAYKIWKKATIVSINDNSDKVKCMKKIGSWIYSTDADIVCLQEDFNYHEELVSSASDKYSPCTYTGGFNLSKIFSSIKWFPYPRFKADGLNLLTKDSRVDVLAENIVPWENSYGYFSHANDKLTMKGFRHYSLLIDRMVPLDVYVVHMDADFYHPEKCPDVSGDVKARASQLKQLVKYMLKNGISVPTIIIGDTNSSVNYSWDVDNLRENLFNPINDVNGLSIIEAVPRNRLDVDRAFYINSYASEYRIELEKCSFGDTDGWSDHRPLVATFTIVCK